VDADIDVVAYTEKAADDGGTAEIASLARDQRLLAEIARQNGKARHGKYSQQKVGTMSDDSS
jgi:hypothetical protein